MSKESFHQLVDRLAVEDDRETARLVLESLGVKSARAVVMLLPLVTQEVTRLRRMDTLPVERRNKSFTPASVSEEVALDRKRLLSERFFNGTVYVLWGEATIEDHEARIAYLSKLRDGLDETIEVHSAAVAEIRAHGVSCLNEIRGAA